MKQRTIVRIAALIGLIVLMALSAASAILYSNANSILFATDFAWFWLNVCLLLLVVTAVLVSVKFLKKVDLNKAIALTALLALLSATASAAVGISDRHHDRWFYDLEEQLTAKYSSIESVELSLDRRGPTLFICCDGLDLPSDSDAIVRDIKDILRIGEDNLFKSSYIGREGVDSNLDFTVTIQSGDACIEYSTGYYLGYDHTESGTVDKYCTWVRDYNGGCEQADGKDWFRGLE